MAAVEGIQPFLPGTQCRSSADLRKPSCRLDFKPGASLKIQESDRIPSTSSPGHQRVKTWLHRGPLEVIHVHAWPKKGTS